MEIIGPDKVPEVFANYIEVFSPDVILDIGSRDALSAIKFRKASATAKIFAFEASPENYHQFRENSALFSNRIHFLPLGVSSVSEVRQIQVPIGASLFDKATRGKRGTHSFFNRVDLGSSRNYSVPCIALDEFFEFELQKESTFALWIDVEGFTYEVLSGASALLERTVLIKLELEKIVVWKGQRLGDELEALLLNLGFLIVAKSQAKKQYDCIFVKDRDA